MWITPVFFLCFVLCVFSLDPKTLLQFAIQQTTQTKNQLGLDLGSAFPSNSKIESGRQIWDTTISRAWTSGFYPGILWKLYNYTKDESFKNYSLNACAGLREEQHNTGTHDVGFIIFCSFGSGFLITKDQDYHQVILTAAHSLSTRYNPIVGCTRSWNNPHFQVIIDNMMNLELLWWSSQNGGDSKYFDMATSHADHMIRDCIKPDGSSYHLIDYDPDTGEVLNRTNTPQGYPDGVWSRGMAFALYGFVRSFMYSGHQRYMDTAIKVANYFISHLPSDFIPIWDFLAPPSLPERDTSAAAIASAGLLDLSVLTRSTSPDLSKKYFDTATKILESLATDNYRGNPDKTDVMLLHGCIGLSMPNDVGLIYGDYYFVEALLNYLKITSENE